VLSLLALRSSGGLQCKALLKAEIRRYLACTQVSVSMEMTGKRRVHALFLIVDEAALPAEN
jgi:hypothetical protein